MSTLDLVVGPSDQILPGSDRLLDQFLSDPFETGTAYLDYVPTSPASELVPEDLAVTLLMNSNVDGKTFLSVRDHAPEINKALADLPDTPLEESSPELRSRVVDLVSAVACWPHIKVSVATKVLHKKRPNLIPVLDNRAIFGALLWPEWDPPDRESRADSIDGKETDRIARALDAIYRDLVRPENESTWRALSELARNKHQKRPSRTEIFDMIWWTYFREREPAPGRTR